MPSWVRFSVAVYLGLLLAGAIVAPEPIVADADELTAPPVRLPWAHRTDPPEPDAARIEDAPEPDSSAAPTRR
ncbi:MAG: hypothetical protein AAF842_08270 [Planctomycetota bacterium]